MSRVGITVEGGLLAADLVERIAAGDDGVKGQQAKDFDIEAGRLSAEIQAAFSDIRVFWDAFKRRREHAQTSAVTLTREGWVIPLLERLGYALRFQRASVAIGGQNYLLSHRIGDGENATPVHIVAWNQPLGQRGDDRRSPHALMQEYLNRSDALWGIVTNGRELRLLRNSARSSRPSYVAVDLETILDGNLYNEFAVVYRLLHRSRLPADGSDSHECLLETWYEQGIEEGGRVREGLRVGVKAALETLGSGFLRHKDNDALRSKIADNRLSEVQLYRELLNLIYRLLFLMVAEERRLLFVPAADAAVRHDVYLRWYGIGRLRERAERRPGENGYADLWEGLKETFRLFREEPAAEKLALSALNGGLFGVTALPNLEDRGTRLRNDDLLSAIHQLSMFEEKAGRRKAGLPRRVNYGGLDVEELGSIYEALLDYRPQVSREPSWGFALAAGSQRKETGSYYTPPELVRELIESALVPVMDARLAAAPTKEDKEKALLSLTICDPAAGSGHFLLAAARRVRRELAIIRTGEAEPAPEAQRDALRDVIRHCLYAVDKNPLAVDLCKVALWIEGHSPGLPLSFLDHRIRCGDSLVGVFDLDVLKAGIPDAAFKPLTGDDKAVCSELRRRNKREREDPLGVFWGEADLAELAARFAELAEMPDGTPEEVRDKAEVYRALAESDPTAVKLHHACDVWTAAFFASRSAGQARSVPTTTDVRNVLAGRPDPLRAALVDELSHCYRFFHWRVEFPEVFDRGGFNVMLGNPPWETMSPDAKEFFGLYDREVRFMSPEDQEKRIDTLKVDPAIAAGWEKYCRDLYTQVEFYKESGRYVMFAPGNLGKGDLNVYRMFVETAIAAAGSNGTTAQFVPENFYNGANAAAIREGLFDRIGLTRLLGFENTGHVWFPRVDTRMKFCMYESRHNGRTEDFRAAFRIGSHKWLAEAASTAELTIPVSLVREFSPDALAVMEFAAQAEIDICRKMYDRYPKFGEHIDALPYRAYMREVEMGTRGLFTDTPEGLPVFEGRMVDLYDYRAKGYRSGRGRAARWDGLPFGTPSKRIQPQWHIPIDRIPAKLHERVTNYRIGFCDVGSPTNERSLVAALLPPETVSGDKVPTLLFEGGAAEDLLLWIGAANSLTMDFIVRKKVALKMSYTLVDSLPFPRDRASTPAARAIISRVYALAAAGPEMAAFRATVAQIPTFQSNIEPTEDPSERAQLMAEIDALVAGEVYGLRRDELRYILDPQDVMGADYPSETFRVLKENEIRAFGEYRTRRLVLEAWDRLAEDGTFDPARLQDPTHFDVVRRALVATRGRVASLERELAALLARSDATPLPALFVEGESDVAILTAAWRAFYPTEALPVTILAAGGTRQMESLAGRGAALRQLLGDRLVFALADNDREGRALVEDGRTRRGGQWRQQSNGIHWCLLAPTAEFEQTMKRFTIDATYWPVTIENAFLAALRGQAIDDGAYGIDEATVQPAFLEDAATSTKAMRAAHQLAATGDDAVLYFRPPAPDKKLAFSEWIAAPARRDRLTFAAFSSILDGLRAILDRQALETNPARPRLQDRPNLLG